MNCIRKNKMKNLEFDCEDFEISLEHELRKCRTETELEFMLHNIETGINKIEEKILNKFMEDRKCKIH